MAWHEKRTSILVDPFNVRLYEGVPWQDTEKVLKRKSWFTFLSTISSWLASVPHLILRVSSCSVSITLVL
jgi:hypothetical protein